MFVGYDSYAVHWVPPYGDPLAAFGTHWTGWSADTGEKHPRMPSPAGGVDLAVLTAKVARFGFHGVLAEPFRLSGRSAFWTLDRTLMQLADRVREFAFHGLEIAVVGGRVALVPSRGAELDALAARVRAAVAPLSRRDEARANGASRPLRDISGGVPCLPATTFHMPLTDRLPEPAAWQVAARLRPLLAHLLETSHAVGEIALVIDPGDGLRARVEQRYPLSDQVRRGAAYTCRGPRVYAPLTNAEITALAGV